MGQGRSGSAMSEQPTLIAAALIRLEALEPLPVRFQPVPGADRRNARRTRRAWPRQALPRSTPELAFELLDTQRQLVLAREAAIARQPPVDPWVSSSWSSRDRDCPRRGGVLLGRTSCCGRLLGAFGAQAFAVFKRSLIGISKRFSDLRAGRAGRSRASRHHAGRLTEGRTPHESNGRRLAGRRPPPARSGGIRRDRSGGDRLALLLGFGCFLGVVDLRLRRRGVAAASSST